MKTSRFFLSVVICFLAVNLLTGCGGFGRYVAERSGIATVGVPAGPTAGLVPVYFCNPSPGLRRYMVIFFGPEPIQIIPDYQKGGERFNRPAMLKPFYVADATGNNWHSIVKMELPRNSVFQYYTQAYNLLGKVDAPQFGSFSTGGYAAAQSFQIHRPTGGMATAGAYVELPYVSPNAGRPDRLRIQVEVDTTPLFAIAGTAANAVSNGVGRLLGGGR